MKAVEYQSQGELQKAIAHFMQAVKLDGTPVRRPPSPRHRPSGQWGAGRRSLCPATKRRSPPLETDNHSAWYNLGYIILEETHQLEEAIKCFSEAARLAPNGQDALVNAREQLLSADRGYREMRDPFLLRWCCRQTQSRR